MDITTLGEDIKSLATQAADVVANKELTQAEKAEKLNGIELDIQAKAIQRQGLRVEAADTATIEAQRLAVTGEDAPVARAERRSVGQQFVESDAFKSIASLKGQRFSSGAVEVKNATISETASDVIQPQVIPGITDIRFQPATVETLLATGQTASSSIRYLKETTATNAAAAVAEDGLKPESTIILAEVDDPVRKIATTIKITDEMLEDMPQVRSYVDSRLGLFVVLETDDQLLNGSGSAPNVLGLRNRSGLAADVVKGSDTGPDAIYKQITAIRVGAFMEPDGIVIHPNDWMELRLSKDSNGQYYAGGPFMGQYGVGGMAGDYLWGLRVVATTAITEGTALVGSYKQAAQVFNRKGLTVEATNSNEDDFKHNRIALRAERRLALAVYRPGAFGEVTGL